MKSSELNIAYVWAANDTVFHTEIGVPYLKDDIVVCTDKRCDWNAISKEMLKKLNMEHIQFNASWMKKDFIKKVSLTTYLYFSPHFKRKYGFHIESLVLLSYPICFGSPEHESVT